MKRLLPFSANALVKSTSAVSQKVVTSSLVGAFHQNLLQSLPQNRWVQRRLRFSGTALSVCITLAGFSLPTLFNEAHAGPKGGVVVGGTGTISKDDLATIIKQTSQNMAIDWDSYNIDATEVVKYIQPNGKSISLNRILGVNGSTIAGKIQSNGQVILINPNGLVFTETAVLNVGGIIASGLNMKTSDFMNGDYIFDEVVGTEGKVINRGLISASLGGNVALIGKQVENSGLISADLGSVTLAAGKQAVLTFETGGLLGVKVSKEILQDELGLDAAVVNSGEINAQGGRVLLTASTSQDVFSQAVNGLDEATSAVVHADGSFTLGGGADLINTGTIDVSSGDYSQTAGQVVAIGQNVTHSGQILANSQITGAGAVELHATDTNLLTENATISAVAETTGQGGDVKVLGDKVGLFDQASVDVSGANGGGQALIGGDYRGENKQIRNASGTYVGNEATINADAITNGDGGEVIVWGNDSAKVYGTINAKGGSESGDGGFVETSAKYVDLDLRVDTSAEQGEGGEWLIDPYNITINENGNSEDDETFDREWSYTDSDGKLYSQRFTNDGEDSYIKISTLRLALGYSSKVLIETSEGGLSEANGGGNITLDAELDINDLGHRGQPTLTLSAHHDVIINQKIYDSNQAANTFNPNLNLILEANKNRADADDGGGDVIIDNDIFTYGGSFTADGDNIIVTVGKQINTDGKKNSAGGAINLTAHVGSIQAGELSSNGGLVTSINTVGQSAGNITLQAATGITVTGFDTNYTDADGDPYTIKEAISALGSKGNDISGIGDGTGQNGGKGGQINLTSTSGDISIQGSINSSGGDAHGKDGNEDATGGDAGRVTIATAGSITVDDIINNGGAGAQTGDTAIGGNAYAAPEVPEAINPNAIILQGATINLQGQLSAQGGTGNEALGKGGNIVLNGTVVVAADNVTLTSTGSTAGDIQFKDTLDGKSGNSSNLSLTGKDITFSNHVGSNQQLGNLTFANSGAVNASNYSISANSIDTTDGTINPTITTTDFSAGNIVTVGKATIAVTNAVNVGTITTDGGATGAVTLNGASVLTTDITTSGGTIGGAVDIAAQDITVGTIDASGSDTGGDISLVASENGTDETQSTPSITLNGDINAQDTTDQSDNGTITVKVDGTYANGAIVVNHKAAFSSVFVYQGTGTNSNHSLTSANIADNAWLLNAAQQGTLNGLTFSGFHQLIAGGSKEDINDVSNDTLTGLAQSNKWTITGAGNGTVAKNETTPTDTITFTGMKNITGGGSADLFEIDDGGQISGVIDGGGGNNELQSIKATGSNAWGLTATKHSGKFNDKVFKNIQTITGSENATDTLTGHAQANDWLIDSAGGGLVKEVAAGDADGISFNNINSLVGNANDDTFTVATDGHLTGTISGGTSGNNKLISSKEATEDTPLDNNWAMSGVHAGSLNGVDFSNMQTLQGSANAYVTDKLTGADKSVSVVQHNAWSITGNGIGTLNEVDAANANKTSFEQIEELIGSKGDDQFVFSGNGDVSRIDGGEGSNRLTAWSSTDNFNSWTVDGIKNSLTQTVNGGDPVLKTVIFSNVTALNGGSGVDKYDVNTNLASIDAGAGNDEITVGTGGGLTTVNGDAGNDIITINAFDQITNLDGGGDDDKLVFAIAGADVNLQSNPLTNIETVSATGEDNKLTAWNSSGSDINVWTVNGSSNTLIQQESDLTELKSIKFSGFDKLHGGTGADEFTISTSLKEVNTGNGINKVTLNDTTNQKDTELVATLLGGTNDDTLEFSNAGQSVDLNTLGSFETVNAATGSNTLTGWNNTDYQNIWTIDGGAEKIEQKDGSTELQSITFSNFDILKGGTGVDEFTVTTTIDSIDAGGGADKVDINELALVTSTITGGAGDDTVNLLLENKTVDISKLALVENVNGKASNDGSNTNILQGITDSTNGWVVDAKNAGQVGTIKFTNFANLKAGNKGDTFTISAEINKITGGDGADTFSLDEGFIIKDLIDGAGTVADKAQLISSDALTLNLNKLKSIENVNGTGGAVYTLQAGNSDSNTWEVSSDHGGDFNKDTEGAIKFTNINNLIAGSGGDGFTISAMIASITGGVGKDTINIDNSGNVTGTVIGGSSDSVQDTLNFTGDIVKHLAMSEFESIEVINGNGGRLTGDDNDNTWKINGVNSGTVAGFAFTGFSSLLGGEGADSFVFVYDATDPSNIIKGSIGSVDGKATGKANSIEAYQGVTNKWNFETTSKGVIKEVDDTQYVAFSNIKTYTGGGAGNEWIDFSGAGTHDINVDDYFGFTGIIGNGAGSTLNGQDGFENNWTVTKIDGLGDAKNDGVNDGIFNNANSKGDMYFLDFANLTGGNLKDSFVIVDDASISGTIDGGAGTTDNSLQANNNINVWDVSSSNQGTIKVANVVSVTFKNIDKLVGGNAKDTFNITNLDLITEIQGGEGAGS
ncbi:hypothetical protein CW745_07095, partial [Psychromonas sp. psych-6C06]|uniref:filamentous hemagglutinin N-terminal domain-containing protein n=1 Tax=Psychromonas sp. psych-6C06 TaxID=2058089 RepID=UPI000CA7B6DD